MSLFVAGKRSEAAYPEFPGKIEGERVGGRIVEGSPIDKIGAERIFLPGIREFAPGFACRAGAFFAEF